MTALARPHSVRGRIWRDPLPWTAAAFVALVFGMPALRPLFAAAFPSLERPFYEGASFPALVAAHLELVAASSAAAVLIALPAGIFVTRRAGQEFRGLIETLVALGQTFPPAAVLALTVPLIGFGTWPALIALTLYGLLPIVENTVSGLAAVPRASLEAGRGLGMTGWQLLLKVELPLAAAVIVAGIRTSVIINLGTAAIASTVGVRTLGGPIILGLIGSNIAYVLQGSVLVALLAVVLDLAFERLARFLQRWRDA
jgi:osmoprotectant transport system permease protein